MDYLKESFERVKQDINNLREEINILRLNLIEIVEKLVEIDKKTGDFDSTDRQRIPTHPAPPSTHNLPLESLNKQNMGISSGNHGASTDRQTDRQTDTSSKNKGNFGKNSIDSATEILNSLDNIKRDIRLKFKRITDQELLIFSAIYQLEEEVGYTSYKLLSQHLNLSESSIRDYIGRLIKKGIPIEKNKVNNKNIQLKISENLKKIVTLPTILQLREL
ncbi:hypothetical protein CMI49_00730 [Candidatus Pacearchaeota archaeon]|jgi:biotin operon repressor|nr:hypothetical protein [Candidatus Pacearchaeota archaeon]|tara:strand:- start:2180 stop:2836 length:657 start_codon:yes stop_codon:yes gene_type:complete